MRLYFMLMSMAWLGRTLLPGWRYVDIVHSCRLFSHVLSLTSTIYPHYQELRVSRSTSQSSLLLPSAPPLDLIAKRLSPSLPPFGSMLPLHLPVFSQLLGIIQFRPRLRRH